MAYLNGPYARKNIKSSLIDELFLSITPALILQILGFLVVERFLKIGINLELIYELIAGPSTAFKTNPDFSVIENSLGNFLLNNVIILLIAILFGKLFRWLVQKYDLDIYIHSLQFNNEWYYLLSGRILDFPNIPGESKDINVIQIDVVVELKEGSYIYSGILQEYYLSKEEGLDRICLSNVYRRKLGDDKDITEKSEESLEKEFDKRYYNMPGNLHVIPFSSIKNINITYYKVIEEASNYQEKNS
jgi:hypothetical protein